MSDEIINAVMAHLAAGRISAAVALLRAELDRNPGDFELARLLNLITPCGMVAEAMDCLRRLKNEVLT